MTTERTPKYPVGLRFKPMGKKTTYTVSDIYTTRNQQNKVVQLRYVCKYLFSGQVVTDYDVPETTIARSMIFDDVTPFDE